MTPTSEARRHVWLAYEFGRAKLALRRAMVAWPLLLIAMVSAGPSLHVVMGGIALFFAIGVLTYIGRAYARAVVPGLLAGLLPLVVPVLLHALGHACNGMECCLSGRCTTCFAACVGAGLAAGVVLGVVARLETEKPRTFLGCSALVAIIVGSLGCLVAGASGVLGMGLVTLAVSMPMFATRHPSA